VVRLEPITAAGRTEIPRELQLKFTVKVSVGGRLCVYGGGRHVWERLLTMPECARDDSEGLRGSVHHVELWPTLLRAVQCML
jgi:hypothetical protein